MKTKLPFLLFFFLSLTVRSQNFTLTFEDTTVINQVFYTDSILDPHHIWQIGKPNKPGFDSAYSQANAVVTLLDSALTQNINASFIISIPHMLQYEGGLVFTFKHKNDFDSLHGKGYVEFSIDSGTHWHGILTHGVQGGYSSDNGQLYFCVQNGCIPAYVDSQYLLSGAPYWWGNIPRDTTSQGLAYFTGKDSVWTSDTIITPAQCIYKNNSYSPLIFRFTAFTDSLSRPSAGWMIDNIQDTFMKCPYGGINDINSSHIKVYPDPVVDGFTLSLTEADVHDYSITILDLMGRQVLYREEHEQVVTLMRGGIAAGSYVVRVRDRQTGNTMEKRVVFE
jgi:hypothetical protein